MKQPPSLQPGDTVGILSTARKTTKEELHPAIELLNQWGLNTKIGKSIGPKEHQFAGNDEIRAEDFQNMMDDAEVKAIWCARGGYGTVRMVDKINFSNFLKNPKWIIGYSDVTVLHSKLNLLGVESLHAEMAGLINAKSQETRQSLKSALFGQDLTYAFPGVKENRTGEVEGELVGGNLSVLYSQLGSTTGISTDGKILFLEDLDEYLYHVDRMVLNLKRNGLFENIKALLIGGMSDMRDNTKEFGFDTDNPFGKTAVEIITEAVEEYDFPLAFNFPAGHLNTNSALALGKNTSLKIGKDESVLKQDFS